MIHVLILIFYLTANSNSLAGVSKRELDGMMKCSQIERIPGKLETRNLKDYRKRRLLQFIGSENDPDVDQRSNYKRLKFAPRNIHNFDAESEYSMPVRSKDDIYEKGGLNQELIKVLRRHINFNKKPSRQIKKKKKNEDFKSGNEYGSKSERDKEHLKEDDNEIENDVKAKISKISPGLTIEMDSEKKSSSLSKNEDIEDDQDTLSSSAAETIDGPGSSHVLNKGRGGKVKPISAETSTSKAIKDLLISKKTRTKPTKHASKTTSTSLRQERNFSPNKYGSFVNSENLKGEKDANDDEDEDDIDGEKSIRSFDMKPHVAGQVRDTIDDDLKQVDRMFKPSKKHYYVEFRASVMKPLQTNLKGSDEDDKSTLLKQVPIKTDNVEEIVSTVSEDIVSTVPEEIVSTVPEEIVSTVHEEIVSTVPEEDANNDWKAVGTTDNKPGDDADLTSVFEAKEKEEDISKETQPTLQRLMAKNDESIESVVTGTTTLKSTDIFRPDELSKSDGQLVSQNLSNKKMNADPNESLEDGKVTDVYSKEIDMESYSDDKKDMKGETYTNRNFKHLVSTLVKGNRKQKKYPQIKTETVELEDFTQEADGISKMISQQPVILPFKNTQSEIPTKSSNAAVNEEFDRLPISKFESMQGKIPVKTDEQTVILKNSVISKEQKNKKVKEFINIVKNDRVIKEELPSDDEQIYKVKIDEYYALDN